MRVLAMVLLLALPVGAQSVDQREATVGMRARIEQIVLPGSVLVARPSDSNAKVVLRVVATFPHGTDHRYDLEYYGLEPGEHDLRDYLTRADGSSTADLPPLVVDVRPVLAPGRVEPHQLESKDLPFLGGYSLLLVLGAVVWVIGLLLILFAGRRRRIDAEAVRARPPTLADRLRPIVEAAQAGRLDGGGKAELERLLLAYWRQRLGLQDRNAADAMVILREHEDAGALLGQLEVWLHRPGRADPVDVTALLAPYRDVPAEILEAG